MENKIYDTIVVGKGPSGISAAIYLKRFNIDVLVIGKSETALKKASSIENYYGCSPVDAMELFSKGIKQAENLGIEVKDEEITVIEKEENFVISTINSKYFAKTVYLATGKVRSSLDIPHLKQYEGKGVSYCAVCDGFFYRGKKIALIGNGDFMKTELETLRHFTNDIIVFSNGNSLVKLDGVEVINEKIIDFFGNDALEGIQCEKNSYLVDGVFLALGSLNALSIAKHLGLAIDEQNNIKVNNYMSNIDGLFAGGDVIGGFMQVSKAVFDGASASLFIKKYLDTVKTK